MDTFIGNESCAEQIKYFAYLVKIKPYFMVTIVTAKVKTKACFFSLTADTAVGFA